MTDKSSNGSPVAVWMAWMAVLWDQNGIVPLRKNAEDGVGVSIPLSGECEMNN